MVEEIPIHNPNENLVKALERLLEQAKDGEIQSIIYAIRWDNSDVGGGWQLSPNYGIASLFGQLDITKQEIGLKYLISNGDFTLEDLYN